MKKIRAAIVGYGNIGKFVLEAIIASPDVEVAGIVRRNPEDVPAELKPYIVTDDVTKLERVDVAILATPTRSVESFAKEILALGINTVDSFDIHGEALWNLHCQLDKTAKKHNAVSVISAGWDPGSDSVIRTMMKAMAPKGITYTNFGPGMSMGHTVAAKSKKGVRNAISLTFPTGMGVHSRAVYVETEPDTDFAEIEQAIKTDAYFTKDNTTVTQTENADALIDMGHSVLMERKGVSGATHNQLFEYRMKINNPALTAQIMVACGRAAMRQLPGAYTMPEIPVIDLLPEEREGLIKKLV